MCQILAKPSGEAMNEIDRSDSLVCSVVTAVILLVMCEGEDFVLDVLTPHELYAWGDVFLD